MSKSGPIFRFQRGEPIRIGREVVSGDPAGFVVTAKLKPTIGQNVPPAETPVAATFEVLFEPAAGDLAARWVLTVPGAVTAGLEPGHYAADAVFTIDGEVAAISGPAFITLTNSVSG